MVLILDGNSAVGTHLWNNIGNLIFSKHLFKSTRVANLKKKKISFFHTAQWFLSYDLI